MKFPKDLLWCIPKEVRAYLNITFIVSLKAYMISNQNIRLLLIDAYGREYEFLFVDGTYDLALSDAEFARSAFREVLEDIRDADYVENGKRGLAFFLNKDDQQVARSIDSYEQEVLVDLVKLVNFEGLDQEAKSFDMSGVKRVLRSR